jgi:hypothetical protein
MLAQHNRRSADANMPRFAALKFAGNFFEIGKERLNELKQLFAFGRQFKRTPPEQSCAEKFFELRDLRTDRRLLDAVPG